MNLKKQVNQTIEYYKNLIDEISNMEKMKKLAVSKRSYLKTKQEFEYSQETAAEIEKLSENIENMSKKINSLQQDIKRYLFEIDIEKVLSSIESTLKKLYPNKEINYVCDTVSSTKQSRDDFYNPRDYYIKKFLYGFEVDGKKFLLPEVNMEASCDYSALEAIKRFKTDLVREGLLFGNVKCFAEKEFQDAFWGLVKENLEQYVKNSVTRYKQNIASAQKVLLTDLSNLLRGEKIDSVKDIDDEKE